MQTLQETWTGSARICRAGEMGPGQHTQFEAGSEITSVSAQCAASGENRQKLHVRTVVRVLNTLLSLS